MSLPASTSWGESDDVIIRFAFGSQVVRWVFLSFHCPYSCFTLQHMPLFFRFKSPKPEFSNNYKLKCTSKATILETSLCASLWYFTVKDKWLWMKYFSSLLCQTTKKSKVHRRTLPPDDIWSIHNSLTYPWVLSFGSNMEPMLIEISTFLIHSLNRNN